MQTPVSTRPGSLEAQQKSSFSTPRVVRKLKTPGSDSDYSVGRIPKEKSPKVVDRRSPRNLASEKRKPTKLSELENQVSQLQDELKKAKLEAEESKQQLSATSAKLEHTLNQLDEISESEDTRIQQLREISHDRDRAWQSELEAIQRQSSIESAALASAMNEIHKLKSQLERVSDSEAHLRADLSETLDLVRKLKEQLDDSRVNEAHAHEEVSQAEMELEVLKTVSAVTPHESLVLKLEESKNRVRSLEELVGQMSVEVKKTLSENVEGDQESEILKNEVSRLRSELESAEKNYRDEYIQSTLEIREAYELVEMAKLEFRKREADLEAELEELRLKSKSTEKEDPSGNDRKNSFEIDPKKLESQLESIKQENETLRSEIKKREIGFEKANDEALLKMSSLTEEAVKSNRQATRMAEELDATQATNLEIEAELRRLKVQSDQWRKAAEAAAAIISGVGNNGKCVERMGSMEWRGIGRKLDLEHSDDTDDEEGLSPKKRNGNVLRKIGVLLKKGQK